MHNGQRPKETFKTNSYDYFRIASRSNASRTIAYDERDEKMSMNGKDSKRKEKNRERESEVVEMSKIDGQYLYYYSWRI